MRPHRDGAKREKDARNLLPGGLKAWNLDEHSFMVFEPPQPFPVDWKDTAKVMEDYYPRVVMRAKEKTCLRIDIMAFRIGCRRNTFSHKLPYRTPAVRALMTDWYWFQSVLISRTSQS